MSLSVINAIAFITEEDIAEHVQMPTVPKIAIAFIGASSTNAISSLSLRRVKRRSNPKTDKIAEPSALNPANRGTAQGSGLAMTC